MVFWVFVLVYLICSENVNFGSKVRPRILGKGFMERRLLFIVRLRDLEYLAGSGGEKGGRCFVCV